MQGWWSLPDSLLGARQMGFLRDLFAPREPCSLCCLGKSSWPSDRSGVADWKLRGHGLRAELLICSACRRFVRENQLHDRTPMLAFAHLVAAGRADRPSLHAYLQHSEWRKIWHHLLEQAGLQPSDEFEAVRMMEPLEKEFMSRGQPSRQSEPEPKSGYTSEPRVELDSGLRRMMDEYGIPEKYIQRKYLSYAVVLQAMDEGTGWNNDIDDRAREIGALTEDEIRAAWTDRHKAILNRIKVALVSEGYIRFLEEEYDRETIEEGENPRQQVPNQSDRTIPDPFPEEIEVPGNISELTIPAVSLRDARNSQEYERLLKTAVGGAANLLVREIQKRTDDALSLPAARGCALDMVLEAYNQNAVLTESTRGFFIGGLRRLDEHWREWQEPVDAIRRQYEEN